MVLRVAAILAICALSVSEVARASSDFCSSLIWAEVAAIASLNSASTAGSELRISASVRAAFISVRPTQRIAPWMRSVIWALTLSATFCAVADR